MTPVEIEIKGLEPVIEKFRKAPKTINHEMNKTMNASLNLLHENVPPYAAKPADSTYRRTGTLGQSLGVSQSGKKAGKPTVYSVSGKGNNTVGKFGTNLSYAQYVIDDDRQAYMHQGRWWTMSTVLERAKTKIVQLWDAFIKKAMDA